MTKEQRDKYLKSGGSACPFCGSKRITADELDVDGSKASGDVECQDCGECWMDVYKLVDVFTEE